MERRKFLGYTAAAGAALMLNPFEGFAFTPGKKIRLVLVGTGHRGSGFWGNTLLQSFGEIVEFVGLCDINPGRLAYVKEMLKISCPTFTDYKKNAG